MGALPYIDGATLASALAVAEAVDELEAAFRDGLPAGPVRAVHDMRDAASLLVMPAWDHRGVGVKLVTVSGDNAVRGLPSVQAVVVLFSAEDLRPLAVLDGTALTALRTAAVSGVATRWLAREDACRLVLFGAGVQASAHLDAMTAVRPVRSVVVVSRGRERAEALVADASRRGLAARLGRPEDVADADLVCTCTTSGTPLFDGALLADGAHVNAVGAFRPDTREVDAATVRRARVVVEERDAALAEAGDLLLAIADGAVDADHVVADLGEVVRGRGARRDGADVTLFKSVGLAGEDLVVAAAALTRLGAA